MESSCISYIAIFVAALSFFVSLWVAWDTRFKPAKIIGSFPYIVIWTFSSKRNGKITDRKIIPRFWLGNIGARSILIEDIRILFKLENGDEIISYPVNSVPKDAVNTPSKFNNYELLSLGGPFCGFSLSSMRNWSSFYNYNILEENYNLLKGTIIALIQIKIRNKKNWNTVLEEKFEFGSYPYHLQKMIGGTKSSFVYSETMRKRKKPFLKNNC